MEEEKGVIRTVTNRSNTNIKKLLKEKIKYWVVEGYLEPCKERTRVLFAQQPLSSLLSNCIRNTVYNRVPYYLILLGSVYQHR